MILEAIPGFLVFFNDVATKQSFNVKIEESGGYILLVGKEPNVWALRNPYPEKAQLVLK